MRGRQTWNVAKPEHLWVFPCEAMRLEQNLKCEFIRNVRLPITSCRFPLAEKDFPLNTGHNDIDHKNIWGARGYFMTVNEVKTTNLVICPGSNKSFDLHEKVKAELRKLLEWKSWYWSVYRHCCTCLFAAHQSWGKGSHLQQYRAHTLQETADLKTSVLFVYDVFLEAKDGRMVTVSEEANVPRRLESDDGGSGTAGYGFPDA